MRNQIEFKKFPQGAVEEVIEKGVSRMVHPNMAILLRAKGLTDDSKAVKKKVTDIPVVAEEVKAEVKPKRAKKSSNKA